MAFPGAVIVSSTLDSGLRTRMDFPTSEDWVMNKAGAMDLDSFVTKERLVTELGDEVPRVTKVFGAKASADGPIVAERARHMAKATLETLNILRE